MPRIRMPRSSIFIVISGLSGAGKSQASKLFEDLGYSCVDNLPPALLEDYLALRRAEPDRYSAFGARPRHPGRRPGSRHRARGRGPGR